MRSFVLLFLAAFLTSVSAFAAPAEGAREIVGSVSFPIADRALPPTPVRRMTNAERLARGLGPAAPQRRGSRVRRQGGASPTPTTTYHGRIAVRSVADNSLIGYISKAPDGSGEYVSAPSLSGALKINFGLPVGQVGASQLNVYMENSNDPTYTLISPIQGAGSTDVDIRAGSYNYGIFGGSAQTARGVRPIAVRNSYTDATGTSRVTESAVWTIDISTGTFVPRWVNNDGSTPPISLWLGGSLLYYGGDAAAYQAKYPSVAIKPVYLQYSAA